MYFNSDEITSRQKGLTFDDVLLVPQMSEMTSRSEPTFDTLATKNKRLMIPIMSANMDTVTEKHMALVMAKMGGLGVIHRFMSVEDQALMVSEIALLHANLGSKMPIAAAIGVKEEGLRRAEQLVKVGVDILVIDIAHGHSRMMVDTLVAIKKQFPHVDVIAGNIATEEAAYDLIASGADALKVGIGPGSMCTTRVVTGHGMPQLTAIALVKREARKYGVPVIADGGIKNSGDIMKALAAGADSVMLGSLLAGTDESPGKVVGGKKMYRGMASKSVQDDKRGGLIQGTVAEGETTHIPYKGTVTKIIEDLMGGLRSGMTYTGAHNLKELHEKALFVEMSTNGMSESKPHGVKP